MGKRQPSSRTKSNQPRLQESSQPRPLDSSAAESDDPRSLGRDLDRCAKLLHQMLESDLDTSRDRTQTTVQPTRRTKMCKSEEGSRRSSKQGKSQSSKSRQPLASVENKQKPTLVITTPNGKQENQEQPTTPQAHFNRRLSSSTPEPGKMYNSLEQVDWSRYYEQQQYQQQQQAMMTSQQAMMTSPQTLVHTVTVTLPSSPVNYSMNHAAPLTAKHPSSVHPTTTYTTPIPTTQQGGNSPPRGQHVLYPSGYYASYPPHVYPSSYPDPHHHSPPTRLPPNVDHESFRNLASRHFSDSTPVQRGMSSPPHQSPPCAPPCAPPCRPDSPRPLEPVEEEAEGRDMEEKTVHFEPPVRDTETWPPASNDHDVMQDSKITFSPDNLRNKMSTLHYLLGELRVVADGDPEASRLVGEVQTAVEEVSPLRSATSFQAEVEQSLQPLRTENSQLRRRLRILNHQLKEREKKEKENVRPDTNFDLAHIQAKYESLQAKYQEEKEKNGRLQQDVYRMEGQLEEVKTDRAKIVMQLSEKETEQMKIKHDWLHESTRLKKDLDSYCQRVEELKQKCELLEREKHILQLTVQQRDTDLTRVQDLLHDYKNRYHTKSSPAPNLSPPAPTSRLTRQALEEFNNSPQNTTSTGHKSPIERLGLENPKTPGCSPKLTTSKESKRGTTPSERSREDKREKSKRVKSPLGASMAQSTPQKKHLTMELDNSNISSVSRDSRCSSPTLVSTNVPSASQVNGQVVMPTMPTMTSRKSPVLDSSVSSVSTEASTITMSAVTARYQPSTMVDNTQMTLDSKFTAPSRITMATQDSMAFKTVQSQLSQDSIFKNKSPQESTMISATTMNKHNESDRYSVTDYFQKYGSSAVERYQYSSAGSSAAGTTFTSADETKSDITLMTNTSVSSINSQDDRSFRAGLANLDANIARLQMALRSSPCPR